jgi:plasmid stabilization system protein ParE
VKTVRNHPKARAEFDSEVNYYFDQGLVEQATAFWEEIKVALAKIQESPTRWRLADPANYPTIRTYGPTKKFRYRIGYIEEEHFICILAYYYSGSEDPLSWTDRADD